MKNTNKNMALWYLTRAVLLGAAVFGAFWAIKSIFEPKTEQNNDQKTTPSDKDLKESLQIVGLLDEIYKLRS